MKKMWMFCAALLLSATTLLAGNPDPAPIEIPPDKIIRKNPEDKPIPNSYVVVLDREGDPDRIIKGLKESKVEFVYRDALNGFAGEIGTSDLKVLAELKEVIFIEENTEYTINEVQQPGATWGLDRVEQRFLAPLDGSYWYYPSIANPPGSFTTHAYVIDTGIAQHANFGGRFLFGPGQGFTSIPGTIFDCHGHGTHVAGTIGSITYGVSKQVALHSVRVLNCAGSGTLATVLAGVNWVTGNAIKPAVANMSIGGPLSPALNAAVDNSVVSGVFYAVAAGNNGADACNFSPSSSVQAFAVAATDINDQRAAFSNFGQCVDIFGPGVNITSLWLSGGVNTISGTSMASPHVAGAAALYLAQYPWAAPAQVRQALVTTGTTGIVGNPGAGSPNLFVFSRAGSLMASLTGTLTAPFQQQVQPFGVAYFTGFGGLHEARLTGPAGTNFDLELWEWSNALMGFNMVASSTGATSTEHVIYHSTTESLYFWIVRSVAGVGAYTLRTSQP